MELNKCLGCMEDFLGYPCPKCGFDPQQIRGNEYALPPQTILAGKYLVGRVLGQGGFGITYLGWDIALERKVAIKEYYPKEQVSRNPGSRRLTWYHDEQAQLARKDGMEMFLKMSRVDDIPGVVRVRELFQENDTAYIVMDFVEGETLNARLKRSGPMSWDQAKEIFRPAIRAMEQVHKAGLIHRDLSPDNLMLTPEGQVFILELGAAKDLNVNQGASSMQVAKHGFSPFEQYTLRGSSGPWTDVYAMAATIYFTLTGKIPPIAIDRAEDDTISWDLPRLDTLPRQALEALKKAMVVSAKKRTQSMEELERGLFEEETVSVSVPGPETRKTPEIRQEAALKSNPDILQENVPPKEETAVASPANTAKLAWWLGFSEEILPFSDWKKNTVIFILTLLTLNYANNNMYFNLYCSLMPLIAFLFGPGSCLVVGALAFWGIGYTPDIVLSSIMLPICIIGIAGKFILLALKKANPFKAAGIYALINAIWSIFVMGGTAGSYDYNIAVLVAESFLENLILLLVFTKLKTVRRPGRK